MRDQLAKIDGQRKEFTGTFERFGKKTGYQGHSRTTILLKDVKCTTNEGVSTNHLWFNLTKELRNIKLKPGDVVQFKARVKEYQKGYKGYKEDVQYERPIEIDYKLSHPTKVKLLERKEPDDFPDDYYEDMGGHYPQDRGNDSLEQPKDVIQKNLDDFISENG